MKELKHWRKLQNYSEKELDTISNDNLKKILLHASINCPKYKNIKLHGNNPHEWLKQFPVLTKEILRSNPEDLITVPTTDLIKYCSSGSTGMQTSVYMSKKEQSNIRAIQTLWWEWSGYTIGSPIVQTGITPNRGFLKRIKDIFFRTIYVSAFSVTDNQLKALCQNINNTKHYFFIGYASSLNVLAEYAASNNYNISFKSSISLGDKLFSHYKKTIESTFKTKVYDTYGCNEGFLIAAQKDLEYKYIMSPHVYVEILDDENNPVPDGELGHVAVTRMDSFSMPLLRYKNGDLAIKLPKSKYPSNRDFNFPLIEKIIGRETDVVKLVGNKTLNVHSFTGVFEYFPEIKQFQVVHNSSNKITIRYITSDDFHKRILTKVTTELQKHIKDENIKIEYVEVGEIFPSKSGKPQIIVSK
ncbi:MAG: phenylacetate--CoA ligase family protein [Flavobacteriales bacterium]|nr:phenylacetate--CoA ligase family protein [Flavobacteriales bacterium]